MISPVKDSLTPRLDSGEAPEGYYAVLKCDAKPSDGGNICRSCDWRQECDGFLHRCMPYAVVSRLDGKQLSRKDGCSVVFKLKPANKNISGHSAAIE